MGRPLLPRPICSQCGAVCGALRSTFCSRACRGASERGISKPYAIGNKWNYRGDAASVWAHYKRMQKLCPKAPCSECGSTEQSLIHHKDHNPRNTIVSNLVRLCRACHAAHHHADGKNLNGARQHAAH